ncbi:MAG: TetR/AcrR family transcriptional regulator [Deltaproteobacteria bacterium]|nr:TetR/AcrR family transcriptional regulator [Deltaproteobacteria bacterium]
MPRTGKNNGVQDQAVRRSLLIGATRLFAQKGYAATSVREIVAESGVTKPTLYYYFGSKEGIYLELMGSTFARFRELLETSRRKQGTVRDRLLDLADNLISMFAQDMDIARMMHRMYYSPPQGAPFFDFDALHHRLMETIQDLISEGIKTGELRGGVPLDMTWAILGALHVVWEAQICHPDIAPGRDGLLRILGLIFQGISAHHDGES